MDRKRGWGIIGATVIAGIMGSSAMGIEAFHERFDWGRGDLSKPTTLRGRVAVIDPYDKAVWVNISEYGGSAESGYYWQKSYAAKSLKVYAANDEIFKILIMAGKGSHNQAAMSETEASHYGLVEIVIQEKENNKRVVQSIKLIDDIAGSPAHPRSLGSLGPVPIEDVIFEKSRPKERYMKYDFMTPDGQTIKGFTPNSKQD